MDAAVRAAVEQRIAAASGRPAAVESARPVGGGSINRALALELADGRRFFLKLNRDAPADMFEREAEGLAALAAPGAIRVPREPWPGSAGGVRFLVMEAIAGGRPEPGFAAGFGRRLAELHRATRSERCGFPHDNYIGSTPQPNGWLDDWVEFWRRRRLGFQLELARRNGLSDRELDGLGDRLLDRLGELIALPDEPACLLHGDLWGGNYLVDEAGEPVLIDPAAYYGHREAELAMTRLFGGFDAAFYSAYEAAWPLPPASETRLTVYELYHLLNHLNLFGRSYRGGCLERLRRLT